MNKLDVWQVETLEDLPLRADDKWYTLLAVAGQKKASWLMLKSDVWREGEEPIRIPEDQIRRMKASLEKLGLSSRLRFRDTDAGVLQTNDELPGRRRYNQICDIFVGITDVDAQELFNAVEKMDHPGIGYALGYPNTAVSVFGSENAVFTEDLPEHPFPDIEKYVYFALSKQHYADELAVVQKWYDVVVENSKIISVELDRL